MRISRQPTPLQIKIYKIWWGMWENSTIWVALSEMIQGVHEKLRPGLPWQKQHSTRKGLSSQAN
jgi:hypothetical protein